MTSGELKMVALTWLRFAKQMSYVATEAGPHGFYLADVLGASNNTLIEIEVKVSKWDLLNDLANKKDKHRRHTEHSSTPSIWRPNRFYYLVTPTLGDEAVRMVESKAPQYGVITCAEDDEGRQSNVPHRRLSVIRSAKWLHREKPSPQLFVEMSHRMASEICGFHMMRHIYGQAFDEVRSMVQGCNKAAPQTEGEVSA